MEGILYQLTDVRAHLILQAYIGRSPMLVGFAFLPYIGVQNTSKNTWCTSFFSIGLFCWLKTQNIIRCYNDNKGILYSMFSQV